MCLSMEALLSSVDDMASYAVVSVTNAHHIKHMKHDIESVRSNVSTLDNSDCCSKRARNKV